MLAATVVGLATLAGTSYATPLQARNSWSDKYERCNALWDEAPKHLAELTVNLANYVDAGTTINETANGAFIPVGTDLGPFCRFSANITTSAKSSVRFEVWLPDDDVWNGVSLFILSMYTCAVINQICWSEPYDGRKWWRCRLHQI